MHGDPRPASCTRDCKSIHPAYHMQFLIWISQKGKVRTQLEFHVADVAHSIHTVSAYLTNSDPQRDVAAKSPGSSGIIPVGPAAVPVHHGSQDLVIQFHCEEKKHLKQSSGITMDNSSGVTE